MDATESLRDFLATGAFAASARLVNYRERVAEAKVKYTGEVRESARRTWDRYAAQEEQYIINRANKIIELRQRHNGIH